MLFLIKVKILYVIKFNLKIYNINTFYVRRIHALILACLVVEVLSVYQEVLGFDPGFGF